MSKSSTSPTKVNSERLQAEEEYTANGWVMYPLRFRLLMSANEAALLAYLMNHARMVQAERKNEGWFYCTMEKIVEDCYVSESHQTRTMKLLRKERFIVTEKRGNPGQRWIKINYLLIKKRIAAAKAEWDTKMYPDSAEVTSQRVGRSDDSESAEVTTQRVGRSDDSLYTEQRQRTKTNNSRRPARPAASQADDDNNEPSLIKTGRSTSPPSEGWGLSCANKLHKALATARKLSCQPSMNKWVTAFVKLSISLEALGHGSKEEVQDIILDHLDWFCAHLDWQYIPKAYSGTSFCDRFVDVMDLRQRWEKSHGFGHDLDRDPSQYVPFSDE